MRPMWWVRAVINGREYAATYTSREAAERKAWEIAHEYGIPVEYGRKGQVYRIIPSPRTPTTSGPEEQA